MQRFDEAVCGRLGVPGGTEQKLERVAFRIDGPVEIRPGFLYFDGGLIYSLGIVVGFEVRPTAFFELWGALLHPAVDRGVIEMQTPFPHHFREVTIAERVAKVPTGAQQNDIGFEMTPLDRTVIVHERNPSAFLNRSRAYRITSIFATQPNLQLNTYIYK